MKDRALNHLWKLKWKYFPNPSMYFACMYVCVIAGCSCHFVLLLLHRKLCEWFIVVGHSFVEPVKDMIILPKILSGIALPHLYLIQLINYNLLNYLCHFTIINNYFLGHTICCYNIQSINVEIWIQHNFCLIQSP